MYGVPVRCGAWIPSSLQVHVWRIHRSGFVKNVENCQKYGTFKSLINTAKRQKEVSWRWNITTTWRFIIPGCLAPAASMVDVVWDRCKVPSWNNAWYPEKWLVKISEPQKMVGQKGEDYTSFVWRLRLMYRHVLGQRALVIEGAVVWYTNQKPCWKGTNPSLRARH